MTAARLSGTCEPASLALLTSLLRTYVCITLYLLYEDLGLLPCLGEGSRFLLLYQDLGLLPCLSIKGVGEMRVS